MGHQAFTGPQVPQAAYKEALALRRALWVTDIKDLRNVFHLNDRKAIPVSFWICPMHTPYVCRHKPYDKFYYSVRAGDLSSQPLLVRHPFYRAPLPHTLLRHPGPECARLECYALRLCTIFYQSLPA